MKKLIKIFVFVMLLFYLFSCSNNKSVSIIEYQPLMAGNNFIFNSEDVNFSYSGMASKNVKAAIDEIHKSYVDGCKVGYEKGTVTGVNYACNKKTVASDQTQVFDSSYVKYNNNTSGLTASNVKNAIIELAAKVPDCKDGYHKANEASNSYDCLINEYVATFYYYNGTSVTSVTSTCNIGSGDSCNAEIPSAVKSSTGTYSNAYYGLSESTGNMTAAVNLGATTVALSQDKTYYAIYSSAVTINYPATTTTKSSGTAYRNQWLSSTSALATTVLATTATGTSSNYSFTSSVSGYNLYGFATAASTNTRTYNDVAALKTSTATTVYAILYKSVSVRFYYSTTTDGIKSYTTSSANQYIRCTSSAAEISNSTVSPTITDEVAPIGTVASGWASAMNSMNITSSLTTANTTYYRVYSQALTIYYPTSKTAVSSINDVVYRNSFIPNSTTHYITVVTSGATGITQLQKGDMTSTIMPNIYGSFDGLSVNANLGAWYGLNSNSMIVTTETTTFYTVNIYSEQSSPITFYYSNSDTGSKTSSTATGTTQYFVYCASTTAAATSVYQYGTLEPPTTVAPYGTTLIGWQTSSETMITSNVTTQYSAWYAIYSAEVTNYYYTGGAYTSRTIYRNGMYMNGSYVNYGMFLSTSSTGTSNYGTSAGPGSSAWVGLSTAADTTTEYGSVYDAARSTATDLYTVYQFNVTYSKGANVSAIGSTSGNCKVSATGASTGGTSCNVTLPSITANTGYTPVGWSTTNGATTGTAAGNSYSIDTHPTTLYANATANALTFGNKTITKTFSTSDQTESNGVNEASNGSGNYSYSITDGNSSNYFSLSGRNLTIAANTPANTSGYAITIKASDTTTGAVSYATYTIVVNKAACTLTTTAQTMKTGATLTLSTAANNAKGSLSYALKSGGNNTTTASTISNGVLTAGAMSTSNDTDQTVDVTITDAGNGNYNGCSKDVAITVQKYTRTLSWTSGTPAASATLTYGGTYTATVTTSGTGGTAGTVAYSSNNTAGATINSTSGAISVVNGSGQAVTITATLSRTSTVKQATTTRAFTTGRTTGNITLSASSGSVAYGTASTSFTVSSHHGGTLSVTDNNATASCAVSGTTVTCSSLGGLNAGTTITVTVTSGQTNNYNAQSATYTLSITQISACQMSVSNPSTQYTGASYNLGSLVSNNKGTVTYALKSGGRNTTTASTLSGSTLSIGAMSTANDDNQYVDVVITDPGNTNYAQCVVNKAVTVQKYTRTLSWNSGTPAASATLTYGTSYTATASASGSGGTAGSISYSSNNTTGATINSSSGAITVAKGNGQSVTITASLARTATVKATSITRAFTTGRATGYVNLSATSGSVTYGTASTTFTVSSHHGGSLSVSDNNSTASCSVSGTTVTCSSLGAINAGTSITVTVTSGQTDNYNSANKTYTLSITKATCATPTISSISTAGVVAWAKSSNCSSAQHQISIDGSNWTNISATSYDYKSTIIAATGTRTVYIKALSPNTTNYNASGTATKSTTVYSVSLTKGTGISAVSGAGNYITGSSVTLGATVSSGYTWSKWTQTSGGAQVSTTQAYSATITGNWTYTANATANSYTVTYYPNGGSGSNTNQSVTYNTSWTTKGAIFSRTGYTLSGWSTSSTGSVTHNLNTSQGTWTRTSNLPLYAVWTPNTYTLKYNQGAQYVSGTMSDTTCTYGTACQVRTNAFTKYQHEFRGWSTEDATEPIRKDVGPKSGSGDLTSGGLSGAPVQGGWYYVFFDAKGTGTLTIEIYDSARSMKTSYQTSWSGSGTGNGTTTITLSPNSSSYNLYYLKWNITTFTGGSGSTQYFKISSNNSSNAIQNLYGYKLGSSSALVIPGDSQVLNLATSGNVNLYAMWYYVSSGGGGTGGGNTGGSGCFLEGTPITTVDGYKNIEDIKVGDIVLSYNSETNETEYKEVTKLLVHDNNNEDLYEIDIGGSRLKVTEAHRFYVRRNYKDIWIAARELKVGDQIMYSDGSYHTITYISHMPHYGTVYNFEVADNHNYFVGENGILVHNDKVVCDSINC